MIAQTFATQHPSRTNGLVLLSSLARTNLPPNIKWKADNLLPMLEYLGKCEQNILFVTFIQLISNCHTPFYFFINSFYFYFPLLITQGIRMGCTFPRNVFPSSITTSFWQFLNCRVFFSVLLFPFISAFPIYNYL